MFIGILKTKWLGSPLGGAKGSLYGWKTLILQFKYACRKKLQLAIPEQIYMVHTNNISLTSKCLHTNLALPRRQIGWDPGPSININVGMNTPQMRNSTRHYLESFPVHEYGTYIEADSIQVHLCEFYVFVLFGSLSTFSQEKPIWHPPVNMGTTIRK